MGPGTGPVLGFKIGPNTAPKWVLELGQFWFSKCAQKLLQNGSWKWVNLGLQHMPKSLLQNGSWNWAKFGLQDRPNNAPKCVLKLSQLWSSSAHKLLQNWSWNWAIFGIQNKPNKCSKICPKQCSKMGPKTGPIWGVKRGPKHAKKWVLELGQFWPSK